MAKTLTTAQAARQLECSEQFVRKLANAGRLPCLVTPLGRLFPLEAVEALRREREVLRRGDESGRSRGERDA